MHIPFHFLRVVYKHNSIIIKDTPLSGNIQVDPRWGENWHKPVPKKKIKYKTQKVCIVN